MDLAEGHLVALEKLRPGVHVYNLGTGQGTSVLQLLNTFMEVNDIDIAYEIVARRPGYSYILCRCKQSKKRACMDC